MSNVVSVQSQLTEEVVAWRNAVRTAGGGFEWNSIGIANQFIRAIRNKSYYSKLVYLLPMLGTGINAARVPLIDTLNVGPSTNNGFVNADFNQSLGLQGDGSSKILDSLILPSQLGVSNNGGLGWWENNVNFTGTDTEVMGCNTSSGKRYIIDLRSTVRRFFCWGAPGNSTDSATNAINGSYYGQRSSATSRVFYYNGVSFISNSTNDSASEAAQRNMFLMGCNLNGTPFYWAGRCGLCYFTDGTLTDLEIIDLNSILSSYLMGPTGKPQS